MIRALLIPGLLGFLSAAGNASPARGWLCVGSPEFIEAARPLIEHRKTGGYAVTLASPPVDQAIKNCEEPPDFVVILGDDQENGPNAPWRVAADRRVYHGWGASFPATFATDMAWGDTNSDGVPDIPVGRLPAQSSERLRSLAAKIVKWEKRSPALSDLTVPVWAGDPGFAPAFRDMALGFLMDQVKRHSPAWTGLWVMQGDERSPFCGWPATQPEVYNRRLQEGGLISAMIGHGRRQSWWSMDLAGKRLEYSTSSVTAIPDGPPTAPHVIFACSCGNFAARQEDSLAEALLHAPGGPVLCVAASEDSHPLTNYYHSTAMLHCLASPGATFGDLWLKSLLMARTAVEPEKELLVRALQPLIIGKGPAPEEVRADHVFLYNIFGDPATKLFAPSVLAGEIQEMKGVWHWKIPSPPPGARLLVQRRGVLPKMTLGKGAATEDEARQRFLEANASLSFATVSELPAGAKWEGQTPGPGMLRLVATGPTGISVLGAACGEPAKESRAGD